MPTGKIRGLIYTPGAGAHQVAKQNPITWLCTVSWWDGVRVLVLHWYLHMGLSHVQCNYWLEPLPTKALCIFTWYGCWRSQRGKLGITVKPLKIFSCIFKNSKCDTLRDRSWLWRGDSSWLCSAFPEWVSGWVFPPFSALSFCDLDLFWACKRLVDSPCDRLKQCSKQTVFQGLVQAWFLIFYYLKSCHMSWRNLQKKCWPGSHLARLPSVTLKVSGSLLWNPSPLPHSFSSSFQSPNLINHVGRGRRGRGRSMWCNLRSGKVTRQHHGACSSPWFYGGCRWETPNRA